MSCLYDRRSILKLGAAAGGLLVLPMLQSRARAADGVARAKRIFIVHLPGGIRSSACFVAAPDNVSANPYGVIQGTGTPFAIGRLLDDNLGSEAPLPAEAYQLDPAGPWAGATVDRLRDVAPRVSVVGTWDESRGDHVAARLLEPTGTNSTESAGILTRVHAGLVKKNGSVRYPPFQLNPGALFGQAPGRLAPYAPVQLASLASLPGDSASNPDWDRQTGHAWVQDPAMHARLDDRLYSRRRSFARRLIDTFRSHHSASWRLGHDLAQAYLNIPKDTARAAELGDVTVAGATRRLTNGMLYELFVRALGPDPADPTHTRPLPSPNGNPLFEGVMELALAVRLLQLGASVVCEFGAWDFHSAEPTYADQYRVLGRALATIQWLLARIPEPDEPGRMMIDRTMVVTTSDFGRDTGLSTGWNSGQGTDHGGTPACYYLGHLCFGGGVQPGRWVGAVDPRTYDATHAPSRVRPRQLLATLLDVLGLDAADPEFGFEGEPPLAELFS